MPNRPLRVGEQEPDTSQLRTAYDIKPIHRNLADAFHDDELKMIPVLPSGQRLEQGATFYDLCEGREFRALGNQVVERDNCVVAKSQVDYEIWDRLRTVKLSAADRDAGEACAPVRLACANCDVPIVDPVVQVVHGNTLFCCPNCAEAFEQKGSGSDPRALSHDEDPRCAHCDSPIVFRATMETRSDKVFCCTNCAAAAID
jgi:hypothetical protein